MGNGTLEITLGNKVVGSLVLSNSLFEELKEGHTLHADSVIAFKTIHGKLELLVLVNKIKEYPYESEFSMFE